jgi:hypothetical protein
MFSVLFLEEIKSSIAKEGCQRPKGEKKGKGSWRLEFQPEVCPTSLVT